MGPSSGPEQRPCQTAPRRSCGQDHIGETVSSLLRPIVDGCTCVAICVSPTRLLLSSVQWGPRVFGTTGPRHVWYNWAPLYCLVKFPSRGIRNKIPKRQIGSWLETWIRAVLCSQILAAKPRAANFAAKTLITNPSILPPIPPSILPAFGPSRQRGGQHPRQGSS